MLQQLPMHTRRFDNSVHYAVGLQILKPLILPLESCRFPPELSGKLGFLLTHPPDGGRGIDGLCRQLACVHIPTMPSASCMVLDGYRPPVNLSSHMLHETDPSGARH